MTGPAILLALGTLAVGVLIAVLLRLLPELRLQLAGLALFAVVLPLGGVLASCWMLFEMKGDTEILITASVAAAASAVLAAILLTRWIRQPLDRLRDTTRQFAAGDLSARAGDSGPSELAEMARAFNSMAVSIERLFAAKRELVAWASHDLRTPLNSIKMMLEAIEDGLAEPAEYLPLIAERVQTLSGLVDDLFELARIDAGVLTLSMQEAELGPLIDSCLRGFEAEARAKRVTLQPPLDEGLPRVVCAPDKVERVLHNLLTNALRHTPSDGAIAIVASPHGSGVTVAVEDTGEGLTRDTAERMFDQFWRAEEARTSSGSGLGLAIARALVEAQGGRMWAENRESGGTRVAFTLQASTSPSASNETLDLEQSITSRP
jgi:signal transduction histidine kinase